ncbi:MAG TPA: FAD-dependent oxidoreductase [Candidatus Limiplasma stercoravium]|nr:FAD-dependent oxidoreductase [Candidatus Limiplasma stercoravium]
MEHFNGIPQPVDVLVIGAGPAGMAAAIAAREAGVESLLVLEREPDMGGILRQCIHNGFGLHRFKEELTGPEYAQRDIDRVRELGIEVRCGTTVLSVDANRLVTAVSREHGLTLLKAKAIVLAMGCRERPRGALATPGTRCAGIYSAGTAQKFVNLEGYMPGKRVVILGSGDIGLIMARRMTLQGAQVLACVELMPYSSGLNRNIVQCLHDYGIPLYLSHTVVDIQGRERLSGVTVAQVDERREPVPGTEKHFDCDTLLLSVGLIPENELSRQAGVEISPLTQGAVVDDTLQTSREGIFACGNVLHVHDLVDFVSAESFKAGRAAAAYAMGKRRAGDAIAVRDGQGVRGVVPQRLLRQDAPEAVQLMFRPDAVYENATLRILDGKREVLRQRKRILTPGEMVEVTLKPEHIAALSGGDVTVCIAR